MRGLVVLRRDAAAVREQIALVVELDDAVAQQVPPLLGMTRHHARRVPINGVR